eukprot:Rhum_TRINITY_DN14548_c8_g1::Rhum_TRINITY_DN14548_c8_g1_i1::g.97366::m.97366
MESVLAWATACGTGGGTVSPGRGSHHDFLSSSGGRECSDCGDAGFAAMWVVRESCPSPPRRREMLLPAQQSVAAAAAATTTTAPAAASLRIGTAEPRSSSGIRRGLLGHRGRRFSPAHSPAHCAGGGGGGGG